jgi:hypothetical protein
MRVEPMPSTRAPPLSSSLTQATLHPFPSSSVPANHALLVARLILPGGVDKGIHSFIVPLRSLDDHSLLPGVVTRDIGPKIAFNRCVHFSLYQTHIFVLCFRLPLPTAC